jgi:thioredoxin-related protein
MKKIIVMVFLSMMFLSCETKISLDEENHLSKYEKALSLAKEKSKIVILKLTSDDCHFCKKMDREVMGNREILAFLKKNFILVEIDVKKEKLPLGLKYKVTPTFFFVNKNEKVISKIQGSWNKKDFTELLEMVLKKVKGEER